MKRQIRSQLWRASVVAAAAILVLGPAWFAHAAQPSAERRPEAILRDGGAVTGSITPEEKASCPKIRKKLWTERDGWIVRRVPVCN